MTKRKPGGRKLIRDSYKLNGHEVVRCGLLEHADWDAQTPHREKVVGYTVVGNRAELEVSTIFIGVFNCIFETAIFGDGMNGVNVKQRYDTWEEAAAGHDKWVAMARKETKEEE